MSDYNRQKQSRRPRQGSRQSSLNLSSQASKPPPMPTQQPGLSMPLLDVYMGDDEPSLVPVEIIHTSSPYQPPPQPQVSRSISTTNMHRASYPATRSASLMRTGSSVSIPAVRAANSTTRFQKPSPSIIRTMPATSSASQARIPSAQAIRLPHTASTTSIRQYPSSISMGAYNNQSNLSIRPESMTPTTSMVPARSTHSLLNVSHGAALRPVAASMTNIAVREFPMYHCSFTDITIYHKQIMHELPKYFYINFSQQHPDGKNVLLLKFLHRAMAVEVENAACPDFICRLLTILIQSKWFPFILDVQPVPGDWTQRYKVASTVDRYNCQTIAERIATVILKENPIKIQDTYTDVFDFYISCNKEHLIITIEESPAAIISATLNKPVRNCSIQANFIYIPAYFEDMINANIENSNRKDLEVEKCIWREQQIMDEFEANDKIMTQNFEEIVAGLENIVLNMPKTKNHIKSDKSTQVDTYAFCRYTQEPPTGMTTKYDTIEKSLKKMITHAVTNYKSGYNYYQKLKEENRHLKNEEERRRSRVSKKFEDKHKDRRGSKDDRRSSTSSSSNKENEKKKNASNSKRSMDHFNCNILLEGIENILAEFYNTEIASPGWEASGPNAQDVRIENTNLIQFMNYFGVTPNVAKSKDASAHAASQAPKVEDQSMLEDDFQKFITETYGAVDTWAQQ